VGPHHGFVVGIIDILDCRCVFQHRIGHVDDLVKHAVVTNGLCGHHVEILQGCVIVVVGVEGAAAKLTPSDQGGHGFPHVQVAGGQDGFHVFLGFPVFAGDLFVVGQHFQPVAASGQRKKRGNQ